jgi:hypothetical protein
MKFSDIEYKRPEIEEFKTRFDNLLNEFISAPSFEVQDKVMK